MLVFGQTSIGLVNVGIPTHAMSACTAKIFLRFEYTQCWEACAAVRAAYLTDG